MTFHVQPPTIHNIPGVQQQTTHTLHEDRLAAWWGVRVVKGDFIGDIIAYVSTVVPKCKKLYYREGLGGQRELSG